MFTLYFSIFMVMLIIGMSIKDGQNLLFGLVMLDSFIVFIAVTMIGGAMGLFDLLQL